MPIAVFAGKAFQVSSRSIYTFNDFNTSSSLSFESQDVEGRKPSTYVKGPGLNSLSFSIPLNINYGHNPRKEYEIWENTKDKATPYPFILGGKPFGKNKWLLKSVNLNDTKMDNKGDIISGVMQLDFEEYVRPGSKKNDTNNSAPGLVANSEGSTLQGKTSYSDIIDDSKKRKNLQAQISLKRAIIDKGMDDDRR